MYGTKKIVQLSIIFEAGMCADKKSHSLKARLLAGKNSKNKIKRMGQTH